MNTATGFVFDAGTAEKPKHDYYLDGKRMTGVTTILGVLAKPALIPWSARMAVEYAIENAVDRGVEEGEKYYTVEAHTFEEAKTAYAKKRDEGGQKGTDTHALIEAYIGVCIEKNDGMAFESRAEGYPEEIKAFAEWAVKGGIRFLGSEVQMYSKEMFVAGTADFVFEKDGKTFIGDIKTFKKIWDRTPFYQCAGYALMWEEMEDEKWWKNREAGQEYTSESVQKIAGYVIFNLPKEREHNPEEDVLWSFDTEGDTKAFLACLEIYRQNANFTKSYKSKK